MPSDVLDNLSEIDSDSHLLHQKMNRNDSCKHFNINRIKKQRLNNQYKSTNRIQKIRPKIRANI